MNMKVKRCICDLGNVKLRTVIISFDWDNPPCQVGYE